VEPEYRGRGIAKALTLECMAEAKRRGIGVVALHASNKGRPVYERLGYTSSNEMLFVEPASNV
jgi:predicted acetyltransferase